MTARRRSTVRYPAWTEDMREFFQLAEAGWTPPAYVKTMLNASKTHLVVEARFRRQDGTQAKLTASLQAGDDVWLVVREKLQERFAFRPEVVR